MFVEQQQRLAERLGIAADKLEALDAGSGTGSAGLFMQSRSTGLSVTGAAGSESGEGGGGGGLSGRDNNHLNKTVQVCLCVRERESCLDRGWGGCTVVMHE